HSFLSRVSSFMLWPAARCIALNEEPETTKLKRDGTHSATVFQDRTDPASPPAYLLRAVPHLVDLGRALQLSFSPAPDRRIDPLSLAARGRGAGGHRAANRRILRHTILASRG